MTDHQDPSSTASADADAASAGSATAPGTPPPHSTAASSHPAGAACTAAGHTNNGHTGAGHISAGHADDRGAKAAHISAGHADDRGAKAGHISAGHADDGRAGDRRAEGAHRESDHAGQPGGEPRSLAARQAELVEALTSGGRVPPGFDPLRVEAARIALLRKRAGEVARHWPMLAAGFGARWAREFGEWAAARPTRGSLRDGWDLARDLGARNALPAIAGAELAEREAAWRYDGTSAPKPRRGPAVRSAAGAVVIQVAGRVRVLRRR